MHSGKWRTQLEMVFRQSFEMSDIPEIHPTVRQLSWVINRAIYRLLLSLTLYQLIEPKSGPSLKFGGDHEFKDKINGTVYARLNQASLV